MLAIALVPLPSPWFPCHRPTLTSQCIAILNRHVALIDKSGSILTFFHAKLLLEICAAYFAKEHFHE
jgi:hypothetical protein